MENRDDIKKFLFDSFRGDSVFIKKVNVIPQNNLVEIIFYPQDRSKKFGLVGSLTKGHWSYSSYIYHTKKGVLNKNLGDVYRFFAKTRFYR